MNSNLIAQICRRILRAYRQHFPLMGGGGYVEGNALYFSFHHPEHTLFLRLTPSNPEQGERLTVNLSAVSNTCSVTIDSTGIKWTKAALDRLTTEELENLENLASRFYLIALDWAEELQLLTLNVTS